MTATSEQTQAYMQCLQDNRPQTASAGEWIKEKFFLYLAYLVYALVWTVGLVFIFLTTLLREVFNWQDFIKVATVEQGWVIVRDLCNMFFVLILLMIAFATILRQESYSAKRLLGKLIIMAVLINFSKMICGLIIDFSQLIMLTFVQGLGSSGWNKLATLLGFDKLVSMIETANSNKNITINSLSVFGALLAGLAASIVATVVVMVILLILVFRIVMLWIYIILSPIAYLCSAFPGGQKYAGQWWSEFTKQVVTGPILAFFYWLALSTAQASMSALNVDTSALSGNTGGNFQSNIPSDFWTLASFQTYMVTLALLVGGLIITQQAGGIAGSMAGKGLGWAQKYTGVRRVRERYGAFAARRESERKRKVEESGDKWFGRYKATTATAGAALQAAKNQTVGKLTSKISMDLFRSEADRKAYREKRRQKSEAKEKVFEAWEDLKDLNTGASQRHGDLVYERNNMGGITVKDLSGKPIAKHRALETKAEFRKAYSPARRALDETAAKKINSLKQDFGNLSAAELRRILDNKSASKNEKQTASMMLNAMSEFKNKEQLEQAKSNIEGLPTLMKEFNDTADRRYGLWNNSGAAFQAKVKDGTIRVDNLDTSQITGETLELIRDTVGNLKFADSVEGMMRTQDDRNKVEAAADSRLTALNASGDFTDNARVHRKFYAGMTGNVVKAMDGVPAQMERLISEAKPEHLSKIKADNFSNADFARAFAHNISIQKLDSMQKMGKVDPLVLKQMVDAAANATTRSDHRQFMEALNKNNTLKSIHEGRA
ncbi:MAG: hypothetical protein V1867_07875 [Candidatus Falkowbacteria bacterium]